MKTLADVKKDQDGILSQYENGKPIKKPITPKEKKQPQVDRKRLAFLRKVQIYIESKPNEQFVKDEQAKLKTRIAMVNAKIPRWIMESRGEIAKKAKAEYFKDNDMKKMKEQLTMINYILS